MFETVKTILDRVYNNIIGYVKGIDFTRQTLEGVKNPERIHAVAVAPEYSQVNEFALQVSQQLPPTTAESIRNSDIGSLEEWGELILGRSIGVDEDPEEYRAEILEAWRPVARGGNRQDLLFWSLQIPGIRRVYPYVGSRDVNAINVDDIEGRLDGAFLYVRSTSGDGIPTGAQMDSVKQLIDAEATISSSKINVTPIILRPYDFEFDIEPSILGGSSSLGEVELKILDITYDILNDTEPFIKYVDLIRRDIVVPGQYLQRIRNIITKPPYRYTLNDLIIKYLGVEVNIDLLPPGNIPMLGSYTFV